MRKVILITGGAKSGKSSYAVKAAKQLGKRVCFIATAIPFDKEMKNRIRLHKVSRPKHWKLIEESKDPGGALEKLKGSCETVLIDCLGLLISNLLLEELTDKEINKKINQLIKTIDKHSFNIIMVSNEVGSGIVPDNPLARRFRDLIGSINQMIAKKAGTVVLMQSGIALTIKGA